MDPRLHRPGNLAAEHGLAKTCRIRVPQIHPRTNVQEQVDQEMAAVVADSAPGFDRLCLLVIAGLV